MKTVILDVRDPQAAMQDFVNVWKTGKAQKEARISIVLSQDRSSFPIRVEFMLKAA